MSLRNDLVRVERVVAEEHEKGKHEILLRSGFRLRANSPFNRDLGVRNQGAAKLFTH